MYSGTARRGRQLERGGAPGSCRLQSGCGWVPATRWPACLRRVGLLPLALSAGADRQQVDKFLYRLYGMYLAVLAARYAHTRSGESGQGEALFPRAPGGGGDTRGRTWAVPCRNCRRYRQCDSARAAFAQDLVRWAAAL